MTKGDKIIHRRYGKGIIIAVIDNYRLQVEFDDGLIHWVNSLSDEDLILFSENNEESNISVTVSEPNAEQCFGLETNSQKRFKVSVRRDKLSTKAYLFIAIASISIFWIALINSVDVSFSDVNYQLIDGDEIPISLDLKNIHIKNVRFKSSNTDILEVDSNGICKAVSPGTAAISVFVGTKCYDSMYLTVYPVKTESIDVDKDYITLMVNDKYNVNYTIAPDNATCKDVEFITDNPDIISIEGDIITALNKGICNVAVFQNDYLYGSFTVDVKDIPIQKIYFEDFTLTVGDKKIINVVVEPENASYRSYRISCDDSDKVSIRGQIVTALSVGKVTLTATTKNGKTCSYTTTIMPVVPKTIDIVTDEVITVGTERSVEYKFSPNKTTNKNVVLKSNNKSVIEIIDNSKIRANSVGTATITAFHDSGVIATKTITVIPVVAESISIDEFDDEDIYVGDSIQLEAVLYPYDVTDKTVKWSTSDSTIATVGKNGLLRIVGEGIVEITATTLNNIQDTVSVYVSSSQKNMIVQVDAECITNNSVGNEWEKHFYVNGKEIINGEAIPVNLNQNITIQTKIIEKDNVSDVGLIKGSVNVIKDYFVNGFYVTQDIKIRENRGKYTGNVSLWRVTYNFE